MRELHGRKGLIAFFFASYAVFWIMLGLTGAAIALGAPAWLQQAMKNLDAWAPTIALLVLFRRLVPNARLGSWLARALGAKVRLGDFLWPFLLQVLAFAAALALYGPLAGPEATRLAPKPLSALPFALVVTLTAGPLGEELGWRAFAYGSMRDRGSRNRVALVLGLVWGFWHLPLWLLSGFQGLALLEYIAAFLVAIVSTSAIIARFYERSRNVLVAMWIHFWFNFLVQLVVADLLGIMLCLAGSYAVLALLLLAFDHVRAAARSADGTRQA